MERLPLVPKLGSGESDGSWAHELEVGGKGFLLPLHVLFFSMALLPSSCDFLAFGKSLLFAAVPRTYCIFPVDSVPGGVQTNPFSSISS